MANLYIYFVCAFAVLALGGTGVDLSKYTNDSTDTYLDISSKDSAASEPDNLDTDLLLSSVLEFIPQEITLNPLYYFSFDSFAVYSFNIRAPPYSS
jgi:hypothetical protein